MNNYNSPSVGHTSRGKYLPLFYPTLWISRSGSRIPLGFQDQGLQIIPASPIIPPALQKRRYRDKFKSLTTKTYCTLIMWQVSTAEVRLILVTQRQRLLEAPPDVLVSGGACLSQFQQEDRGTESSKHLVHSRDVPWDHVG